MDNQEKQKRLVEVQKLKIEAYKEQSYKKAVKLRDEECELLGIDRLKIFLDKYNNECL